jgi:hypothetical protein
VIGRIKRGFDFLSYHFSPAGLAVAAKTIANVIEKASRLYKQKRSRLVTTLQKRKNASVWSSSGASGYKPWSFGKTGK